MKITLLVDAMNLAHRNYHALALRTSDGVPTGMIHGFLSSLLFAQAQTQATSTVILWDTPTAKLTRRKIFPGYKAHRDVTERAPDFDEQLFTLDHILSAMGLQQVSHPKYEADDLAQYYVEGTGRYVIFSNDADLMQLVTEDGRVQVLHPKYGLMGWKQVQQHLGVKPSQVADFKAITGDSSDEYKGVHGIGPKTAQLVFLLNPNLDGLFTTPVTLKIHHLPLRAASLILQNKDEVAMCRELAKLKGDRVASVIVNQCLADFEQVEKKLKELELNTLLGRIHELKAMS